MENSLSFLDVFDEKFLEKLYSSFESHVNKPFFDESFFSVICMELLPGDEWAKIKKVMHDFGTVPSLENIASFLVAHCFTVWFAKQKLENRKFNILEKTSLVGWVSFCESDQPEGSCPETSIIEVRDDESENLISDYFEKLVDAYSEDYQNFLNEGGDANIN
jgi:hypothetical protein